MNADVIIHIGDGGKEKREVREGERERERETARAAGRGRGGSECGGSVMGHTKRLRLSREVRGPVRLGPA